MRVRTAVLVCAWGAGAYTAPGQTSGYFREVFRNLATITNRLTSLTNNAVYPHRPVEEHIIDGPLQVAQYYGDYFGDRIQALITPPSSGDYRFSISSDDESALFLSTSTNPADKVRIAYVTNSVSLNNYTAQANQTSGSIALTAGARYYLEVVRCEGSGNDHLAVRWRLPNSSYETPIPATRLTPCGMPAPVITTQPSNRLVNERGSATYWVHVQRPLNAGFQWQCNGTNVAGGTSNTLTVTQVPFSSSGSVYRCLVTNLWGAVTSQVATLGVLADAVRPTLVNVSSGTDPQWVVVRFSEPVDPATATNAANYLLNGSVAVEAVMGPDGQTVHVRTTGRTPGFSYVISVSNVRDLAHTPNTIVAGSSSGFVEPARPLFDMARLRGTPEPPGPTSRRTALAITEIMYHPAHRMDGRNPEFVEIYNSQPFPEDLSGWRLRGQLDVDFPDQTYIGAWEYILATPSAADLSVVYPGLTNRVFTGSTNRLSNSGGTVRLENDQGATLLEVEYDGEAPWPVAADGAGHSLVLWRPSYGQGDPRSWTASAELGGSPGAADPAPPTNALWSVQINEVLAHTDPPDVDYIELYNYSAHPVNVGGCVLTDDPDLDRFVIPSNTVIPALGHQSFDAPTLGFALDAAGETVVFREAPGGRVIDALEFPAQENGVAWGRYPDGAPRWGRLATKTPGGANGAFRPSAVVLNELMYHPISDDDEDEFVELFNRSAGAVSLASWRLEGGIEYTFPSNAVIPSGGYVVVARNIERAATNHPGLAAGALFGNYTGVLSDNGERIALTMPDEIVSTNETGRPVTNRVHVLVEEVTYVDGGRWGRWSDGGGSSLERIDPEADARLPSSWADSDESAKCAWTNIECSGAIDNGATSYTVPVLSDQLHLFQLGEGEMLVDDVEVYSPHDSAANLVGNGTFDGGFYGWTFQGTHDASGWAPGEGAGGGGALYLRAAARGDTGANRIRTTLARAVPTSAGSTARLKARVRWLRGWPEVLLRVKGNWIELTGNILTTHDFGTPGAANSRAAANAGPAITDVTHGPILPARNEAATVSAQIHDPDGLFAATLYYRVDPSTAYRVAGLTPRGAGLYAADIPGLATNGHVAFYIEATDGAGATVRFPDDAPAREGLVRFGEGTPSVDLGIYRLWFTWATEAYWRTREKNSNKPLDATFVYGGHRVIYNMNTLYSGSPFHSKGYTGPLGGSCDYVANFPRDEMLLGEEDFVLAINGDGSSGVREPTAHWMLRFLGVPYNYKRFVHLYVNGVRRAFPSEPFYEDVQQPNASVVEEWFPDDSEGDLLKIEDWFEFDDAGYNFVNYDARLQKYTTTGGALKTARYRWNWRKRAIRGEFSNYTNLYELVENANMTGDPAYAERMDRLLDEDNWIRIIMTEHFVGNYDSYGYNRGKNMYAYKPEHDPWHLLPWDIEFGFGNSGGATDTTITPQSMSVEDPVIRFFLRHPPFVREWWRAAAELCEEVITANPTRLAGMMDSRYTAFTNDLVRIGSYTLNTRPSTIRDWIMSRRAFTMASYQAVASSPFAVTTGGGASFSTNANLVRLSGTAPFPIETLWVNGIERDVTWTTVTNWQFDVVLNARTNALVVEGLTKDGAVFGGLTNALTIYYTGALPDDPRDALVINEIMYNPLVEDAEFVEIYNRSATTPFDLSGWRLDGVDFTFPDGIILGKDSFILVVKDWRAFEQAYGTNLYTLAGEYEGNLDRGGETLKLIRPGATPAEDTVMDEVTYDDDAPWPADADGYGASLQLVNPALDNNRVAHWGGAEMATGVVNPVTQTHTWRYLTNGAPALGWTDVGFNDASWLSGGALLYREGSSLPWPKTTAIAIGSTSYYFRTSFEYAHPPSSAGIGLNAVIDDGAVVYLNGQEMLRIRMTNGPVYSTTFAATNVGNAVVNGPFPLSSSALLQGVNVLAAEVHQIDADSTDVVFGMELLITNQIACYCTPGQTNRTGAVNTNLPAVWLNEAQPRNASGPTDRMGERDPWLELYNSGATAVSLNGFFLSTNYANPALWTFPANAVLQPGEFKVVWLDGEPAETVSNEWHASFVPAAVNGAVVLSAPLDGRTGVVDYLNYTQVATDRSYGAYPDGAPAKRRRFYYATPGATNRIDEPAVQLYVNEWMADNAVTRADPADGDYDDWFEIHNAGTMDVDLSGYFLTDNLGNTNQFTVPDGMRIRAGEYLVVWADEETKQNDTNSSAIHTNFKLSLGGDQVGVFKPDGSLVDAVSFGPQATDISQGRWPDDGATFEFFTLPTPGASNRLSLGNSAPVLGELANRLVNEETLLTFAVTASDPDTADVLTYTLFGDHPAGVSIHPGSGVLTWTPSEAQGPSTNTITVRVTDNGSPPLYDEGSFTAIVHEVARPPALNPVDNQAVDEEGALEMELIATDPDIPVNSIRYRLEAGAPDGASVDPAGGQFSWVPSEAQGPGTYWITATAYDPGYPAHADSRVFRVDVGEVNQGPQIGGAGDQVAWVGVPLAVTNQGYDADLPANTLEYELQPYAPDGAAVNPATGVFTWTPPAAASGTTNSITVRVTDNGAPVLWAESTFNVVVPVYGFAFTAVEPATNHTLALVWNARPGRRYRIEARTAMIGDDWMPVTTVDFTNASMSVTVPLDGGPQRYYRVVEE